MSTTWAVVLFAGLSTVALKAVGPVLLGGRDLPPRVDNLVGLLAPALLAALVVTQVFTSGEKLVVDARAVGLAAAVLAILARAPVIVVIVAAAAATALVRAV